MSLRRRLYRPRWSTSVIFAVAIVGLVIGYAVGHRMGVKWARFDARFQLERADGQFQAAVAEKNELKVKLADAMMRLEDARK